MKPIFLIFGLSLLLPLARAATWFEEMEIGPSWASTFRDHYQGEERIAALKGLLVDLGQRQHHALFDTETLRWVVGYQGFVQWGGTPWTGEHGKLVTLQDQKPIFITPAVSGYADVSGSFEDKRPIPGHGNLPVSHGRYLGYYKHQNDIIISHEVLGAKILESCRWNNNSMQRHWQVGSRKNDLRVFLAEESGAFSISADGKQAKSPQGLQAALVSNTPGVKFALRQGHPNQLILHIPAGASTALVQVAFARDHDVKTSALLTLQDLTQGGPPRYQEFVSTVGTQGQASEGSAWAVDAITLPENNPWKSNLRFGGFDFLDDNTAVLSTWNGDVWKVSGFQKDLSQLRWRRIASGLFESLGLKVVKGIIYVNGRDQITRLHDLNGDEEMDYYEAFNRDVIITSNFHEFTFDLQTDVEGNFYFCKGSPVKAGGRGFDTIQPHHGIVAKVSADGKKFEVLATGLRAPGGLGVGPKGQITTGENEGTWQPCCKVNFFTPSQAPVFLGTEPSRHELCKERTFHEPICYLPMSVDNSGGSQVWVPQGVDFGLGAGELIHLSYGQSSLYRVMMDPVGEVTQAAVTKIPVSLQSSAMRARFHPDGSLFVLGFRGWQTNAPTHCAFQRIRFVKEKPNLLVKSQQHTSKGVVLHFDQELDEELANDPTSYAVERWNYVRGPQYGSGEFSVDQPDEKALATALQSETHKTRVHDSVEVLTAKLGKDGKSVELELKGMKPCMTLKIAYDLENVDGDVMIGETYSTIKALR